VTFILYGHEFGGVFGIQVPSNTSIQYIFKSVLLPTAVADFPVPRSFIYTRADHRAGCMSISHLLRNSSADFVFCFSLFWGLDQTILLPMLIFDSTQESRTGTDRSGIC